MKMPHLCSPAMLYLVISIITIVLACFYKCQVMTIVVKIAFILLWTWFLNFLCSKGYKSVSWFLVILPYLLIAVTMLLAYEVVKKNNSSQTQPRQQQQKQTRSY
jgi:hypothetical protein